MSTKSVNNLQNAARPIVYFNWLMGMGVDRQPNFSNTANIGMQIYTSVFIIVNWIMIYIGWHALRKDPSGGNTPFEALIMYKAIVVTNVCISVIAPLLTRLQRKTLKECLRQVPMLNDTFEAILGVRFEYRKQYISQISQILAIILVMCLLCISDMLWLKVYERSLVETVAILVTLHYPIILMLMMDANFCYLLGNVRTRFRELNKGLLRLAEKSPASQPGKKIFVISRKVLKETEDRQVKDMKTGSLINENHYLLHEIRKIHLELCKMSGKINHAFGPQNLVSISTSFVMVTGLLYTIYTYAIQEGWSIDKIFQVGTSGIWAVIYSFKILMVNHMCWSISSEALRTGEVIYELLESKVEEAFQREVQEFGLQMLQNPVRFNACGFFTLDYSFVQGVIGSITTYLVILIQMSNFSVKTTSNAAFANDGTKLSEI